MITSLKSMGKGCDALLFPIPLGRRRPSTSSEVSSSELSALWGTLLVPLLNNPSFVFDLFRRVGPTTQTEGIRSSATERKGDTGSKILFFLETGLGLYPAASYKSGKAFLNLSRKSVERRFCSWKMGSLTIWAQSVPCFS
jgi:hypothetical protein